MILTQVNIPDGVEPTLKNIESIRLMESGVETLFSPGDKVWLEHTKTSSLTQGTLSKFFGVGRLRGVTIEGTPFGDQSFFFGQPQDTDNGYRIEHV